MYSPGNGPFWLPPLRKIQSLRRMNILTVADFFYPVVTGGASIVIYEIMLRLVQRGHRVTVLTRNGEFEPFTVEGIGVRGYKAPDRESFYPLAVYRCTRVLAAMLKERKFDIVNMHHGYSGLPTELVKSRRASLPSVYYFHGPWHKEAMANAGVASGDEVDGGATWKFRFRKGVDRFILKRCSAVVGLSDYMLNEAVEIYPGTAGKMHKVPGGVDTERFKPAGDKVPVRHALGIPPDKTVLLTVRRLVPRMGLENLVKAMAAVESAREDVVLLIGGKGELAPSLQKLISQLNLKRTSLVGYIPDEQLHSYYQASDLFITPSLDLEGFGLVTLEAMACGLPVLGTPVGGTTEILREVLPDFILPGFEVEQIAQGIIDKMDQVHRLELHAKVADYARNFTWERATDAVEAIFEDAVDRESYGR